MLLNQKINELLEDAEKTVADMTDSKENYPDPTDRASLESDRNFELRMRDRERRLIAKMQEAIKRIDEGEFGVCEVCGGPISEKRLIARPVTTLCIDCKTRQEKLEKLKGEWSARRHHSFCQPCLSGCLCAVLNSLLSLIPVISKFRFDGDIEAERLSLKTGQDKSRRGTGQEPKKRVLNPGNMFIAGILTYSPCSCM